MALSGGSAATERERCKQRAWQHLDQTRCQQEHMCLRCCVAVEFAGGWRGATLYVACLATCKSSQAVKMKQFLRYQLNWLWVRNADLVFGFG